MSKTVYTYITRGDVILYALADNDFGDHGSPRHAPHSADKKLTDWERNAKIAFGDYVARVRLDGDWEYSGSSRWSAADPEVGMTVAVYESPVADFAGDQLATLVEHPWTVFRGYVEFVDQSQRYAAALLDLDELARVTAYKEHLIDPVGSVLDQSREHYDTLADIDEVLSTYGCHYDGVSVIHGRRSEAA
ncbi:hypothetical protein [Rhizobium leguminosarum]|uniref:hypothetical protein n=1 Tax=Rhizobium leguminosarum TaxID=384 RepID=UPI0014419F8A|nr:hypothetical protein [Rhizobium leguminosarum]NKJ77745.1 hypothetical protein [Rhizobium leguminosarum bv. viciae]